MNQPELTQQALSILRTGDNFQWVRHHPAGAGDLCLQPTNTAKATLKASPPA